MGLLHRTRIAAGAGLLLLAAWPAFGATVSQSTYDASVRRWALDNKTVRAEFELSDEGAFRTLRLKNLTNGDEWTPAASRPTSLIRFEVEDVWYNEQTAFELVEQYKTELQPAGVRQTIVLREASGRSEVTVNLEIFDGQPVLRHWLRFRNLAPEAVHVKFGNMFSWTFGDAGKRYSAMRVNQWMLWQKGHNFEPVSSSVNPSGLPIEVYSGAHGDQCAWVALRDSDNHGLFVGWEFDGRARATVKHARGDGYVNLAAYIVDLYHPVASGTEFDMPAAFVGLFRGDWDEAGYRTQRFVEAALAKPAPDGAFPYVAWDSWGYETALDEATLRREATAAAAAGVELFIVDLGWSRAIGDWRADEAKFPSGLRALSDHVHSLGMKFGLHFAFAEASSDSPVLRQHPDWVSTENNHYYGADSICLSHQPVKEWIVAEAIRMIDDYDVDWILQDGENMVKTCTNPAHTHDPRDSNYSNAVDGLNAVVSAIQKARPKTLWENCEDGGNMMTFNMVRSYVTSITNDASGSLASRQAVFGATYPFPPRYTDRYMPKGDLDAYNVNSYRFGGPWIIMRSVANLAAPDQEFLANQIRAYKSKRASINSGKVFHLTAAPGPGRVDVLQSYNVAGDEATAVVTREGGATGPYQFKPKGLNSGRLYRVWFEQDARSYVLSGTQLMRDGVEVPLPSSFSSEVVHVERQR